MRDDQLDVRIRQFARRINIRTRTAGLAEFDRQVVALVEAQFAELLAKCWLVRISV
jgi:hypothetical protein